MPLPSFGRDFRSLESHDRILNLYLSLSANLLRRFSQVGISFQARRSLTRVDKILYVVCHGLFCLMENCWDDFTACMLDMQDEHKYLYGNWLFEKPVPPRAPGQKPWDVKLYGVTASPILPTGNNVLDPDKNMIYHYPLGQAPPLSHADVRAIIRLPRPRQIHYFVPGNLAPDALRGTANAMAQIPQIPKCLYNIRVFEYTYDDIQAVYLGPTTTEPGYGPSHLYLWRPGTPVILPGKNKQVSVLHLYDEPAQVFSDEKAAAHGLLEFNKSLAFLGAAAQLTATATPTDVNACPNSLTPDGLISPELSTLSLREVLVGELLKGLRTQKDGGSGDGSGGGSGGPICTSIVVRCGQ